MFSVVVLSNSEKQTKSIAEKLGKELIEGDIVFLYGELGTGKTIFVKGLARALGIKEDEITSASFVIISEHEGVMPFYHIDLYRLEETVTEEFGFEEYMGRKGITAVEWAEKLKDWEPTVKVYLKIKGSTQREIRIESKRLLKAFSEEKQ